jgi:uncharacterized YigZ family protein
MIAVKNPASVEIILKKSRFIGALIPCDTEQDVPRHLKGFADVHPHASHIVYAYRMKTANSIIYRFHDAGEPTGTAGKPIFQHLEGKELINVLLVVVRYFGGVKLGAGGLTRAYSNTASQVIAAAELCPYIDWVTVPLTLDYKQIQPLEYLLKKLDGRIVAQDFAGQVKVQVQVPAGQVAVLLAAFAGDGREAVYVAGSG